jgi:hypothetical protein
MKKFFPQLDPTKEFAAKLMAALPKSVPSGSSLSVAFMGKKGGVEIGFDQRGDKENNRTFTLSAEGAEELGGVLQIMRGMIGTIDDEDYATVKAKLLARIPEMLR